MNSNMKQTWFSCPQIKGIMPLRSHSYNRNTVVGLAGAEDKKVEVGT